MWELYKILLDTNNILTVNGYQLEKSKKKRNIESKSFIYSKKNSILIGETFNQNK